MKRLILTLFAFLLLCSFISADWIYNPYTRRLDYYEPAGAVGAHAASHEVGGADLINHDNLTGFVAGEHVALPGAIAAVLTDHNLATHNALNITQLGTVATGVWQGTAVATAYGGIGKDSSGWTGVVYTTGGNWFNEAQLANTRGGTGQNSVAWTGVAAVSAGVWSAKTIGIADNNAVEIDHAAVVDNDYAKFTANGLEGREYSEVRTDLGLVIGVNVQAYDADLDDLADGTLSKTKVEDSTDWDQAYTHSQDNTQAHTDYLLNSGDDSTVGSITMVGILSSGAALDVNTNVVQDVNIWDTIASGNPSINIYGWNTAGGDRESAELTMDDTNDEFLIQVPNSANNEGVTVSLQETNQRFRVRHNSDAVSIYHDGTDAQFHTTDGTFIFDSDEAAAVAQLVLYDDDTNYVTIQTQEMAANWTWTLPATDGGAGEVFYDSDGSGTSAWADELAIITNGVRVQGTNVAIIELEDGTYDHLIKASNAEGLAGSDLRIGLDEALRMIHIMDDGDIDTDLGMVVETHPTLMIWNAAGTDRCEYKYTGMWSDTTLTNTAFAVTFRMNADRSAYNFLEIDSSANMELTDTNGHQAWVYIEPKINQADGAGDPTWTALQVDVTVTGDDSTVTNKLFDLQIASASVFEIEEDGDIKDLAVYSKQVTSNTRAVLQDDAGYFGNATSSRRYKKEIRNMENTDWIYDLRPINFAYKTDENGKMRYGLLAEEVAQVNPALITVDKSGRPETVEYRLLIPILLNEIQQLRYEVDALKAKTVNQ